ncbi:MAG: tetratricopeptide repeat protein [Tannerella sp.]|jgi:tetratricopeptide (TPR) repeat protein|nr:tetratricopeptide repeat protein [Tannerella sp.]
MNTNTESEIKKAMGYQKMAQVAMDSGKVEDAKKYMDSYYYRMEGIYNENPNDERMVAALALSAGTMTMFYSDLSEKDSNNAGDNFQKACSYAKTSSEMNSLLYENFPDKEQYARGFLRSLWTAFLINRYGDKKEAQTNFEKIETVLEQAEYNFPENDDIKNFRKQYENYINSQSVKSNFIQGFLSTHKKLTQSMHKKNDPGRDEVKRKLRPSAITRANMAIDLCNEAKRTTDNDVAISKYKEGISILRELSEETNQYVFHLSLAICSLAGRYNNISRYEEAEEYYLDALTIQRKLPETDENRFELAFTLSCCGCLHSNIEQYTKAENDYNEAISIFRDISKTNPKYRQKLAKSLESIGEIHYYLEQYDSAKQELTEAVEIFTLLGADIDKNTLDILRKLI